MSDSHIILYTIQPRTVLDTATATGRFTASWEQIDPDLKPAYLYMCAQMRAASIDTADTPPFWTWAEPKDRIPELAHELLSEADWEQDLILIELSVPRELALLSSYFGWNEILDSYLEQGEAATTPLSALPTERADEDDPLQVTLPYLDANWITSVEPLTK